MNVFTYGSLMYPIVWQQVVGGQYHSSTATIHGFRRVCVRDETYPALIISSGAEALRGRVYFDVCAADIDRLDHFETGSYQRVAIAAAIHDRALTAEAYLALNLSCLTAQAWSETAFEQHGLPLFLATYVLQNNMPK